MAKTLVQAMRVQYLDNLDQWECSTLLDKQVFPLPSDGLIFPSLIHWLTGSVTTKSFSWTENTQFPILSIELYQRDVPPSLPASLPLNKWVPFEFSPPSPPQLQFFVFPTKRFSPKTLATHPPREFFLLLTDGSPVLYMPHFYWDKSDKQYITSRCILNIKIGQVIYSNEREEKSFSLF